MSGEHDLSTLLAAMHPTLRDTPYVFCSITPAAFAELAVLPLGVFHEDEGVTVIVTQAEAQACGLPVEALWACVTLTVHSSLSAVGFLATVATRLAQLGNSVNAVAGYYHDHLFVPWERRESVMEALYALSAEYRGGL